VIGIASFLSLSNNNGELTVRLWVYAT